jgi:hypothetical protein
MQADGTVKREGPQLVTWNLATGTPYTRPPSARTEQTPQGELLIYSTEGVLWAYGRSGPPGSSKVAFSQDGQRVLNRSYPQESLYLRRPEPWWGIAWLPEFWLTALFAAALAWSVWRDRRTL